MVIKSQVWCVATELNLYELESCERHQLTEKDKKTASKQRKTTVKLSRACEMLVEDTGKNRQVKRT